VARQGATGACFLLTGGICKFYDGIFDHSPILLLGIDKIPAEKLGYYTPHVISSVRKIGG